MRTNSQLKKGLVVGIIVLVGMNIVPSMAGSSTETHQSIKMNTISDDVVNWTINGTKGNNGCYISPLNFSCAYDHDVVAAVYYTIGRDWQLYTGPFTVYLQGSIYFMWDWVDYQGNTFGPYGPYWFRVDYTSPVFNQWSVIKLNLFGTKWLLAADLSDPASGVNHVEFYVDGQLVGTVNATPWEFHYQGKGKMAQAIAYDNAGNSASSPIVSPYIQQQRSPLLLQIIMFLRSLVDNFLPHHRMNL